MLEGILFIVTSIALAYVSRPAFSDTSSHGFTRFWAWEAMLALIVLNARYWFVDPFSAMQLISWVLLLVSLLFVFEAVRLLHQKGYISDEREEATLYHVEKTTVLVTSGLYKYIRHPMYSSLLLLAWGAFFKHISTLSMVLALASSVLLFVTAKRDEKECLQYFGDAYRDYMSHSKRFIPFLY